MNNRTTYFFFIAILVGFLSACSSDNTTDQASEAGEATDEPLTESSEENLRLVTLAGNITETAVWT